MAHLSRRTFIENVLGSLLTFSLLETLFTRDLFAQALRPITEKWLKEVNEICSDLRRRSIEQTIWQRKVEDLFSRVELSDLLRFIDFDALTKNIEYPDDRATTRDIHFPRVSRLSTELSYIPRLFAMRKGRAIVPHGHRNMVSGHMILKGQMHVRHYERIKDEPQHIIIQPTIDRVSDAGQATTISERKDNIHWLKALSDTAFTFDVIVVGLVPERPTYYMDFIDPLGGEKMKDGLIRARRLQAAEVFKLYGKS